MAWLRVDDGMPEHRKVLGLPRKDRWTWLELLCYVARQNNGGHVPEGITDVLKFVTPKFVNACLEAGLLDRENDGGFCVHDWDIYNGETIEQKVAAYLSTNPEAGANDVHRAIGGKREIVLAVVRRFQGNQQPVPKAVPREPAGEPLGGSRSGTQSVHARAHPSPTPITTTSTTSTEEHAAAAERLRAAGWTQSQLQAAIQGDDLELGLRWLEICERDPTCTNPGALAWTKTLAGLDPNTERQPTLAQGAQGTRSTSPPLPDKPATPEPERIAPPPEFIALTGTAPSDAHAKNGAEPVVRRARKSPPEGATA